MKIVVFTGAGVSRESGLLTFRDSVDGLWNGYDVSKVASIQGWWSDPGQVLDFYNQRRREIRKAQPNDAHMALAELEAAHEVIVITQNIDDLHERAGSKNVIHLHGEIFKVRPENDDETIMPWTDDLNLGHPHTTGSQLRPHIVWFGEGLPELDRALTAALAPDVDVLIVVGTTLNVYPAAFVATDTKASRVYLVDPNPPGLPVPNLRVIAKSATEGVREVVAELNA